MKADDMQTELALHDNFKNEKTLADWYIQTKATGVSFSPSSTASSTPLSKSGDRLELMGPYKLHVTRSLIYCQSCTGFSVN